MKKLSNDKLITMNGGCVHFFNKKYIIQITLPKEPDTEQHARGIFGGFTDFKHADGWQKSVVGITIMFGTSVIMLGISRLSCMRPKYTDQEREVLHLVENH